MTNLFRLSMHLKRTQLWYFELLPRTKLPFNWDKPRNSSFIKIQKNQRDTCTKKPSSYVALSHKDWELPIHEIDFYRSPSIGACNYPIFLYGVFTDRSIFSLHLSRIQIPTGTSVTNCNHKHGLMLTCRHVHVRLHCFILPKLAHVDWNWPISREIYLKIDWSVKCRCIGILWELQAPSNGSWFLR